MDTTTGKYAITDRLSKRLAMARFHVRTGEQLGAQPIRFVASRTIFVIAGLYFLSTHIVALEKDGAKSHDIDELFGEGYRLARRINKIPLPRGMQFGYTVMPLIIGKDPDSEALLYAASPLTMPRYSLFNFPVVIDLTRCQVAFFEGFTKFGGGILPSVQDIVTKHLEPVVDEGCS